MSMSVSYSSGVQSSCYFPSGTSGANCENLSVDASGAWTQLQQPSLGGVRSGADVPVVTSSTQGAVYVFGFTGISGKPIV